MKEDLQIYFELDLPNEVSKKVHKAFSDLCDEDDNFNAFVIYDYYNVTKEHLLIRDDGAMFFINNFIQHDSTILEMSVGDVAQIDFKFFNVDIDKYTLKELMKDWFYNERRFAELLEQKI